jgi:hypothetical protein
VKRSKVSESESVLTRSIHDELIDRYISPHPHRVGIAGSWLPQYGYSVWILADALNDTNGDIARVAAEYEIPQEAVEAVAWFYQRHRKAIDAKILVNALDFNAPG